MLMNKPHGIRQFNIHACITLEKKIWIIGNSVQYHVALHGIIRCALKEVRFFEGFFSD